ncbi:hypothetical protein IW262DRAFT_1453283 [Armillaria fumosa]|nr:hypothetical protein IW262DRAFT_1453283 [Armillaria fumosa]
MRHAISRRLDYELHKPSLNSIISHISALCDKWASTPQIERELDSSARALIFELVNWLPEIGWFLTSHGADLGLINRCLDACSDALQVVERAVPEEIFNDMCHCRLAVALFGDTSTMPELIVRALVPRHYYAQGVGHKETRQEIIHIIAKHDRSSLVYDGIHDIRTDGWYGWGDQTWMAHWSKETRRQSTTVQLDNRAAGRDAPETLVFVENP